MNDNSSTNRSNGRILSDERMDSLLKDFFRLEVPVELNQPLRRPSAAVTSPVTLAVGAEYQTVQSRPRSVRFVSMLAAVASMGLVVMMMMAGPSTPSADKTAVNGSTPKAGTPPVTIDQPMLVSPEANSPETSQAIAPDGVTLEETDVIELHPRK